MCITKGLVFVATLMIIGGEGYGQTEDTSINHEALIGPFLYRGLLNVEEVRRRDAAARDMSGIGLLINAVNIADIWSIKEVQSWEKVTLDDKTPERARTFRLAMDYRRKADQESRVKALKQLVEYLAQHPKEDEKAYEDYSYDYVKRFVDAHAAKPPPAP